MVLVVCYDPSRKLNKLGFKFLKRKAFKFRKLVLLQSKSHIEVKKNFFCCSPFMDFMIRYFVTSVKTYCLPYTVTLLFRLPRFLVNWKCYLTLYWKTRSAKWTPSALVTMGNADETHYMHYIFKLLKEKKCVTFKNHIWVLDAPESEKFSA